jgi:hypothetical protein
MQIAPPPIEVAASIGCSLQDVCGDRAIQWIVDSAKCSGQVSGEQRREGTMQWWQFKTGVGRVLQHGHQDLVVDALAQLRERHAVCGLPLHYVGPASGYPPEQRSADGRQLVPGEQ